MADRDLGAGDLRRRCRASGARSPEDLAAWQVSLREAVGAGEPLNPEVIERVKAARGLVIRDGYGQTETTLQIGNFPGQRVKPGAVGRPAPGYRVRLVDGEGR